MTRSDWERRAKEWTKRDIHEQRICPTDWIEHWAQQAFIAGARAMNEAAARVAAAEANSFEADKSGDYRDAWYLCARGLARSIRALIGDEGEQKN